MPATPASRRSPNRRRRHARSPFGPVGVAAALAVALLAGGCTSSPDASPSGSTAVGGGAGAALATGEMALPVETPWTAGSWAGPVDGTEAFIAIVAGPSGFVAYACDDATVAEWFRADDAAGTMTLTSEGNALLSASLDGDTVTGTFVLADGEPRTFTAVATPEPIHRSDGFDETEAAQVGWVTLASGERRGAVQTKSLTTTSTPVVKAAPALTTTAPIVVTKTVITNVATLSLPPASPLTPDVVNPPTANTTKFVWTALGDSYASGEGAPVAAGRFGRPFFNIEQPTDWGRADTVAGITVEERRACHRSEKAGAPVANERLKAAFPDVAISFGHYACSGAEAVHVMEGSDPPYDGPDLNNHVPQPGQADRAADFASRQGGYDAVYLSIGGNDVGFGDVIVACLVNNEPGKECSDQPITRDADPSTGRPAVTVDDAIADLASTYEDLDAYLKSTNRAARPGKIFISKYPDPTKGEGGVDCGDDQGHLAGDFLMFMSKKEARWARENVLNKGMNDNITAAGTSTSSGGLGWIVIDSHLAAMENHGLCAQDHFFNTNNDGLESQGDDYDATVKGVPLRPAAAAAAAAVVALAAASTGGGVILAPTLALAAGLTSAATVHVSAGLVHPNVKGFEKYADAIEAQMKPLIEAKLKAGLRAPARVRQSSGVNNGEIVVRWDDKSSSEDRYEVTLTKLEGTGTIPTSPILLARNIQEVRIPANGRVAVKVQVRACQRTTCGDPGSVDAVNFVPSVPTDGAGSYTATQVERVANSLQTGIHVGWVASPFALKYVVAHRQVDPSGTVTGQATPTTPFGGLAVAEPALGTAGNPKAVYAFRISACSRIGCSAFSPEVSVDARGPAPTVKTIRAGGVPVGIERPELVVAADNRVTVNPMPLPAVVPGKDPTNPTGSGVTIPTPP